ncbi:MAG: hypothetical protein ACOWWR_06200 [Eubacteriales bacterium]
MEQEKYLEKLKDPKYWFRYALNQKFVGDQILNNCILKKEVILRVAEENSEFETLWANAHFHYGIGIENGLKGIVIKYHPDKIKFEILGTQVYLDYIGGKPGKRHDLLALAESLDIFSEQYQLFKCDSDKKTLKIVLDHLSDMIKWGARYPIPNGNFNHFVFDESIPLTLVAGFHILDVIEPIFQLFKNELE